jgi:hypothetical protein
MVSSSEGITTNVKRGAANGSSGGESHHKETGTGVLIKFPYTLYENDSNWVPPLLMDDYRKINRKKHPFYQHAEAEFFFARKGGNVAGRIAAIHDSVWEQTHKEKAAYWGWFECENDPAVAKSLFDVAFEWARARLYADNRSHVAKRK